MLGDTDTTWYPCVRSIDASTGLDMKTLTSTLGVGLMCCLVVSGTAHAADQSVQTQPAAASSFDRKAVPGANLESVNGRGSDEQAPWDRSRPIQIQPVRPDASSLSPLSAPHVTGSGDISTNSLQSVTSNISTTIRGSR